MFMTWAEAGSLFVLLKRMLCFLINLLLLLVSRSLVNNKLVTGGTFTNSCLAPPPALTGLIKCHVCPKEILLAAQLSALHQSQFLLAVIRQVGSLIQEHVLYAASSFSIIVSVWMQVSVYVWTPSLISFTKPKRHEQSLQHLMQLARLAALPMRPEKCSLTNHRYRSWSSFLGVNARCLVWSMTTALWFCLLCTVTLHVPYAWAGRGYCNHNCFPSTSLSARALITSTEATKHKTVNADITIIFGFLKNNLQHSLRGDYSLDFMVLCLVVCRNTQNLTSRFSPYLMEGCSMDQQRTNYILWQIDLT